MLRWLNQPQQGKHVVDYCTWTTQIWATNPKNGICSAQQHSTSRAWKIQSLTSFSQALTQERGERCMIFWGTRITHLRYSFEINFKVYLIYSPQSEPGWNVSHSSIGHFCTIGGKGVVSNPSKITAPSQERPWFHPECGTVAFTSTSWGQRVSSCSQHPGYVGRNHGKWREEDVELRRITHVSHLRGDHWPKRTGWDNPAHCGYVSIIISNKWKMETDWKHQRVVHWVSWYRYYRFSNSNLAGKKKQVLMESSKKGAEVWRVEKQWLSQSTTIEASDGWCFCANVQKQSQQSRQI